MLSLLTLFMMSGGMSVLFSVAKKNRDSSTSVRILPAEIVVLIPAHNEEKNIGVTLESLSRSFLPLGVKAQVHLGCDACSDQTEAQAQRYADRLNLSVSHFQFKSKWKVLEVLSARLGTNIKAVVFMDAGTVWDENVLQAILLSFKEDVSLVGPSYRVQGAGKITQIFWKVESFLKSRENALGGPVSFHGATFAVRLHILRKVFQEVARHHPEGFKNDDVAIPLMSRILEPKFRTVYLSEVWVNDQGTEEDKEVRSDFRRRLRMNYGNFEVLRFIFLSPWKVSFKIGVPLVRRVLRPFWIYPYLGLIWSAHFYFSKALFLLGAPFLFLTGSALASALAPIEFMQMIFFNKKAIWK